MSKDRAERRREARIARKAGNRGQEVSRRRFLTGAVLGAGGLAVAGALYGISRFEGEQESEVDPFDQDMRTIVRDIEKTGFTPNPKEQNIWKNAYQRSHVLPATEQSNSIVMSRLFETIDNMGQSENKHFRRAASLLNQFSQMGLVQIRVMGDLSLGDHEVFGGVQSIVENNILQHVLYLNGGKILNDSSGFELALGLTHEVQHLEDRVTFQATLPSSLSAQERIDIQKRNLTGDHAVDELKAYAVEAEALIEAYRMRVEGPIKPDSVHVAAEYVKAGKDYRSVAWKNYITSRVQH